MDYSFLQDPTWKDVPEDQRSEVIGYLVDQHIEKDPTWADVRNYLIEDAASKLSSQIQKDQSVGRKVADVGIDLAKGAIGLGQDVVGLGSLATGGLIGKALDATGYDVKKTDEFLSGFYSEGRKQSEAEIAKADGFFGTLKALAVNPDALIGRITQSAPGVVAIGAGAGAVARKLGAAAAIEAESAGLTGEAATKFISDKIIKKVIGASAGIEGAQSAGGIAEQGRTEGSPYSQYAPAALAGGAATTGISLASGGIARKLGIGDVETDIAMRSGGGRFTSKELGSLAKQAPAEFVKEGALEEAPQSYIEQLAQNYATGKPLTEGATNAAAEGFLTGGLMGAGHSTVTSIADRNNIPSQLAPGKPVDLGAIPAPSQPVVTPEDHKAIVAPIQQAETVDDAIIAFEQAASRPIERGLIAPDVPEYQPIGLPSTAEQSAQVLQSAVEPPAISSAETFQQGIDSGQINTPYVPEIDNGAGLTTEIKPEDIKNFSIEELNKIRPSFKEKNRPNVMAMIDSEIKNKRDEAATQKAAAFLEKQQAKFSNLPDTYVKSEKGIPEAMRPILSIMKEEANSGGVESANIAEEGYGIGDASSHAPWVRELNKELKKEGGFSVKVFNTILDKKESGKPLTVTQDKVWSAILAKAEEYNKAHPETVALATEDQFKKMGYEANFQQPINVNDLRIGDSIIVDGTQARYDGINKDGQAIFKIGQNEDLVDPFETLTPDAIKRSEPGATGIQGMVESRRIGLKQEVERLKANRGGNRTLTNIAGTAEGMETMSAVEPINALKVGEKSASIQNKGVIQNEEREGKGQAEALLNDVPKTPDASVPLSNESQAASEPVGVSPTIKESLQVQPEVVAKNSITEKTVHDHSNTQVNLPDEDTAAIREFSLKIPDTEIYSDPNDDSYGRETQPHITVRYGMDTIDPQEIEPAFKGMAPIKAKMGKVSIFETDKYDVVKVDIESHDLHSANKRVGETVDLPGETFKDYQPHATIAYVKKGEGKKYVGNKSFEGRKITIDKITLITKDGKTHEFELKGKPSPKKLESVSEKKARTENEQQQRSIVETPPDAQGDAQINEPIQTQASKSIKDAISKERPGMPVEISELRKKLPGMSKADFDKSMIDMQRSGELDLVKNAQPISSLTDEDKAGMIQDGKDNYFMAVNPKAEIDFSDEAQANDLLIHHNLSESNLLHAIKMGGIPVPSLAVTKKGQHISKYGEITLVGSRDMADPKGYASTKVFGADIYSPRYPNVRYDLKDKHAKELSKTFHEGEKATGSSLDYGEIKTEGADYLKNAPSVLWSFLDKQGVKPNIVMENGVSPARIADLKEAGFEKYFGHMDIQELTRNPEFQKLSVDMTHKEHADLGKRNAFQPYDKIKDDQRELINRSRNLAYEMGKVGKPPEVNSFATRDSLRKQVRNELATEFDNYVQSIFSGLGSKEKILSGIDSQGNRKYSDHTIENVVKILKKNLRSGEGFSYGVGNVRAKFTPEFKTIAEIKASKNRLVDSESFAKVKEEVEQNLFDLANSLESYHPNRGEFSFIDKTMISMLEDSATMGIPRALNENGFKLVPKFAQEEIAQYLTKLKNMPTEYFEAKILRNVFLHEFSAAIVPDNISKSTIDALKNAGVKDIRMYKASDMADRQSKISESNDLYFSDKIKFNDQSTTTKSPLTGKVSIEAAKESIAPFAKVLKENGIDVVVYENPSMMKSETLKKTVMDYEAKKNRSVKGFLVKDDNKATVFLFSDRASSLDGLMKTALHESIGHEGLYRFMGEDLNAFIDYVLRHPGYGLEIKATAKKRQIDFLTIEGRNKAAREWFAELVENGDVKPTLWSKFVVYVKNALRKWGVKNEFLTKFDDNDIREIVRGSFKAALDKKNAPTFREKSGVKLDAIRKSEQGVDYSDKAPDETSVQPITASGKVISQIKAWGEKHDLDAKLENVATYLWDQNAAIKRVQEGLPPQPVTRDYNLAKRLMGSAITTDIKSFDEKQLKPFLQQMADSKLTIPDVEELAHAEHAPERNLQKKRDNAERYYDSLIEQMTGKESEAYRSKRDEIGDIYVMEDQTWNQRKDNVVDLVDRISADIQKNKDRDEKQIEKDQAKLDNRDFTDAELEDGVLRKAQKRIDNAKDRLDERIRISEQWEDVKDRLSGMTNERAAEISDKWKDNAGIREAVDRLRSINEESLELLRDSGAISDEEYKAMKGAYKFHVPLIREGFTEKKQGLGRGGHASLAKPIKIAAGSTRGVSNIFANVVDRHIKAINDAHRSEADKVLVAMVKANKDDERWSIAKQDKKPRLDSEGNIRFYEDRTEDDNEIYVRVNGEKVLVSVPPDNLPMMRFMEALKRQQTPLGPVLKMSAKVTRFMAALNTSFSPEFLFTNFVRDFQTASIHLEDSEAKGMQKEVWKGIKGAIKGIYQAERGNESSAMAKLYREYESVGGKIGWMQGHENVAELAETLQKELEFKEGKHPNREKLRKLGKWIETMNTSVENGVRLSMYKVLVDKGIDPKRAAMAAKSLTVDFTQHGTVGPIMNSLYMFANAGIQGNVRMIQALTSSPKVRKIAAGIIGFGAAANLMGMIAGGDDDDGEAFYDKLKRTNPDLFERNMVFMIPGSKGDFVKFPMPYGYNTFFVLGNEIAGAIRGQNPIEAMSRFGTSLLGTLNPLQAATLLQTVVPTLADPIAQVAEEKMWHGGNLMPEKNPFGIPKPDSERYFKSVNPASKMVAEWLNSVTGGNKYKPGMIDVSPETFDMLIDTYTGSSGRLAKDALFLPISAFSEDGLSMNKVPFARKMIGTYSPERTDSAIYRENNTEVDIFAKRLKEAVGPEKIELARDPLNRMVLFHKETEHQLLKLNKQAKLADSHGTIEAKKRLEKRMIELKQRYNKKFNELKKR